MTHGLLRRPGGRAVSYQGASVYAQRFPEAAIHKNNVTEIQLKLEVILMRFQIDVLTRVSAGGNLPGSIAKIYIANPF